MFRRTLMTKATTNQLIETRRIRNGHAVEIPKDHKTDAHRLSLSAAIRWPAISDELKAELSALISFYASRISAVRINLPPHAVAGAVKALLEEQTVAVQSLLDRASANKNGQEPIKPPNSTDNRLSNSRSI